MLAIKWKEFLESASLSLHLNSSIQMRYSSLGADYVNTLYQRVQYIRTSLIVEKPLNNVPCQKSVHMMRLHKLWYIGMGKGFAD